MRLCPLTEKRVIFLNLIRLINLIKKCRWPVMIINKKYKYVSPKNLLLIENYFGQNDMINKKNNKLMQCYENSK